jgi:hypothetical protein
MILVENLVFHLVVAFLKMIPLSDKPEKFFRLDRISLVIAMNCPRLRRAADRLLIKDSCRKGKIPNPSLSGTVRLSVSSRNRTVKFY